MERLNNINNTSNSSDNSRLTVQIGLSRMPGKIKRRSPFLIGVAGGTASGKSTVCEKIMENLRMINQENTERHVVHISQDSFYRELKQSEKVRAERGLFNFDHPGRNTNNHNIQRLQGVPN